MGYSPWDRKDSDRTEHACTRDVVSLNKRETEFKGQFWLCVCMCVYNGITENSDLIRKMSEVVSESIQR